MKRGMVLCCLGVLLLSGCQKGDKGEKGDSGLVGTKTYTGTPTANPNAVYCPEITDLSKQVVSVYATSGNDLIALPLASTIVSHSYAITSVNRVEFTTVFSTGDAAGLLTWDHYPTGKPSTALMNPNGVQYGYRIDIKTFNSAPARQAYLASRRLDNTVNQRILYGKEQ